MIRNSDKPQIATVIFNKITNQFFVTFNNFDAKSKGLIRPKGNYKWTKKRAAEIHAGTVPLSQSPSVLHNFDAGLLWAFEASNLDDWQERRMKRRLELKDVSAIEKRLAYRMESRGFSNIRAYKTKGPEKTKWDSYSWGAWTPENKTQKQIFTMLDKIGKAMNKEIPMAIKNRSYYEMIQKNTIKNKCDLWNFFKQEGLFSDD